MRRPLVAFDRGSLEVFAEIERRGGRAQGRQEGEIMPCRRFVLLATPAARGFVFSIVGCGSQWLVKPGVA